jgi:hypothetical protein
VREHRAARVQVGSEKGYIPEQLDDLVASASVDDPLEPSSVVPRVDQEPVRACSDSSVMGERDLDRDGATLVRALAQEVELVSLGVPKERLVPGQLLLAAIMIQLQGGSSSRRGTTCEGLAAGRGGPASHPLFDAAGTSL